MSAKLIDNDAFNLGLLKLNANQLKLMAPITSLDIYETANSTVFHPDGLFSTRIFGRMGEEGRDTTFAYIPLKTIIIHPVTYTRLVKIKGLYGEILTGKGYAIWNPQTKDFESSNDIDGQTGYQFFMSHWHELSPPRSQTTEGESSDLSTIRNQRVALFEKYREQSLIDNLLVMPAGLRDIEIDPLGRVKEGEINALYRRVLSIVNTIADTYAKDNDILNNARVSLQNTFNEIYDTIESMLKDKRGYLQSKWASRKIVNGTRNVISAMNSAQRKLGTDESVGPNDTIIGLWQTSRGALPITRPALKRFLLDDIFASVEGLVSLIDKKTLKLVQVNISSSAFDKWTTKEGLDKIINQQSVVPARAKPIEVDGYYLALVYRPKDKMVFKVFRDITELPEGFSKDDVYPITLVELIYLCNYKNWNKLKLFVTRYPVFEAGGEGSIYPSNLRVATTVKSDVRIELDENWEPINDGGHVAKAFPNFTVEQYIDSMVVHPYRVKGLNADYDGDTTSGNIVYSEESIKEVNAYLNTKEAYLDPAGGFRTSIGTDTLNLVLRNMTGT